MLVIAFDGELNPSTRLRILQYLPALEREGFRFSTHFVPQGARQNRFDRERLAGLVAASDIVFVQRVLAKWVLQLLERTGKPVIFDLDDALHYIRQSQYPAALAPRGVTDLLRNAYRSRAHGSRYYSGRKKRLDKMLKIAAATIVGNQWLFEELGLKEDRAVILPTSVWLDGVPTKRHEQHRPVIVGWIGVRSNLYHLNALDHAFAALRERYEDGLELRIVSSAAAKTPLVTRFTPWSLESEADSVSWFDIGLMPLRDDPFSRGKCAFKAVFCMSRGVPVVASPVGANVALIEHGENGLLAKSTDEWVEAISALADDAGLRARMGRLARATIEERYSAADVAVKLSELLARAAGYVVPPVNDEERT